MVTRRSFIKSGSIVFVPTGTTITESGNDDEDGDSDIPEVKQCDCRCAGGIETSHGISIQSPPDFTVSGVDENGDDITVSYRWKDQEDFEDSGFSNAEAVAWLGTGDNNVWLNRDNAYAIDQIVIAHEFGHHAGYPEHIGGSIMAAYYRSDRLKENDTIEQSKDIPLTDVTKNVINWMDGARVINWRTGSNLNHLSHIARSYARGDTTIKMLGEAVTRYQREDHESVWFNTTWNNYGGDDAVHDENKKTQFYSYAPF